MPLRCVQPGYTLFGMVTLSLEEMHFGFQYFLFL
jgi:hypothetical protein